MTESLLLILELLNLDPPEECEMGEPEDVPNVIKCDRVLSTDLLIRECTSYNLVIWEALGGFSCNLLDDLESNPDELEDDLLGGAVAILLSIKSVAKKFGYKQIIDLRDA